jgi:hypothetical protein
MPTASYPFNQFFATNITGVVPNAGTSSETIKAGQLILTDRDLNAIDAANTSSVDLSTLHVVYGRGDLQPIVSAGIPTDTIRLPISRTKYKPFVPLTYDITTVMLLAKVDTRPNQLDTFATLRIVRTDNYTPSVVAGAGLAQVTYQNNEASAMVALKKWADGLNGVGSGYQSQASGGAFTATLSTDGKTLSIKSVAPMLEEVGSLMTPIISTYVVFDHTDEGIEVPSTTKFDIGAGSGMQIAEMEQAMDVYQQRNRFTQFPSGYNGAINKAGFYNTIGIRWDMPFLVDMGDSSQRQLMLSIAFPTDAAGTVGAQEAAFVAALAAAIPKAHNLVDADTTDLIEAGATAGSIDGAALIG